MMYGITVGDSSGVGPEILLKAYVDGEIKEPFVAYGDIGALQFYNERLGYKAALKSIASPAQYDASALCVIDHGLMTAADVTPGALSKKSGHAAREYVISAAKAALKGDIAAMITLPMNKEATQLSDPVFTGHTELIGEVCAVDDVTIMLASDQLIVTHISTHVSLINAIRAVKKERVLTILRLTAAAVQRLVPNPRIAVAGLNPHAGENGLFGTEEIEEIQPAIDIAKSEGLPIEGPFPPDTLFYMAVRKHKFDAVVCMYHDQGHVPLKLLDFEAGVNITLGLPIIRTSVDHGTAFDIAGRGIASTVSLLRAMEYAVRLAGDYSPTSSR